MMHTKVRKDKTAPSEDPLYRFVGDTLFMRGKLFLPVIPSFLRHAGKELKTVANKNVIINLDQLEDMDSAGVTALYFLAGELKKNTIDTAFEGGHEGIRKKMELFSPEQFPDVLVEKPIGFFESVGNKVFNFIRYYLYEFLNLAASVFYFAITDLFRSKTRREGEIVNQAVLIGVNAVLIVSFMAFIIGLILALQSSQQLRSFGANIYIVDLTVIAMMSQMGPLITAILVAGRSGSAIAAEIATMKVTSELDALQTMGLDPIRFVVVPKLYASMLTMPFLIVLANVSGIIGGAVAAWWYLDITPEIFINRMSSVMTNHDLVTAFVKSQVSACLIVLTGSFYGFRVVRGAEGVGISTTSAVVVAISLVIVSDSLLGLLFY